MLQLPCQKRVSKSATVPLSTKFGDFCPSANRLMPFLCFFVPVATEGEKRKWAAARNERKKEGCTLHISVHFRAIACSPLSLGKRSKMAIQEKGGPPFLRVPILGECRLNSGTRSTNDAFAVQPWDRFEEHLKAHALPFLSGFQLPFQATHPK